VLAAITNDLKTPLHNLLTHLELAESSNDLAQIKLFADIAARSGQMLLHNVNDFIDYSYFIKNGLFNLCKRYFLLRHFIADF
jgi:signal transduction histidine kinase